MDQEIMTADQFRAKSLADRLGAKVAEYETTIADLQFANAVLAQQNQMLQARLSEASEPTEANEEDPPPMGATASYEVQKADGIDP